MMARRKDAAVLLNCRECHYHIKVGGALEEELLWVLII
jgi:hypothetical protein